MPTDFRFQGMLYEGGEIIIGRAVQDFYWGESPLFAFTGIWREREPPEYLAATLYFMGFVLSGGERSYVQGRKASLHVH